jgi:hypothetical protein
MKESGYVVSSGTDNTKASTLTAVKCRVGIKRNCSWEVAARSECGQGYLGNGGDYHPTGHKHETCFT